MSRFEVPVARVRAVEPIPNADRIELAVIGDYRSVVPKGKVVQGDLVAYLPEAALVPDWIIDHLGLQGKLAGPERNRIKAIKLRSTVSQGIVLTVTREAERACLATPDGMLPVEEGMDLAGPLGIRKYEPPVPTHMAGEVTALFGRVVPYDIENLKKYPDLLQPGEPVAITEKIHGTFCEFGNIPGLGHPELIGGDSFAASKGLGAKGLVFKDNPANAANLYNRAFHSFGSDGGPDLRDRLLSLRGRGTFAAAGIDASTPLYLMGEVFGEGVQDLTYGVRGTVFRGFDAYLGAPGRGRFLDFSEKQDLFGELGIDMVPVLYRGPWDKAVADGLKEGRTTLNGGACVREGGVITPQNERVTAEIGRLILKHVGDGYLMRKDGTEYV